MLTDEDGATWHEYASDEDKHKGESHWYRWNGKAFTVHWLQWQPADDGTLGRRLARYYRDDVFAWEKG